MSLLRGHCHLNSQARSFYEPHKLTEIAQGGQTCHLGTPFYLSVSKYYFFLTDVRWEIERDIIVSASSTFLWSPTGLNQGLGGVVSLGLVLGGLTFFTFFLRWSHRTLLLGSPGLVPVKSCLKSIDVLPKQRQVADHPLIFILFVRTIHLHAWIQHSIIMWGSAASDVWWGMEWGWRRETEGTNWSLLIVFIFET